MTKPTQHIPGKNQSRSQSFSDTSQSIHEHLRSKIGNENETSEQKDNHTNSVLNIDAYFFKKIQNIIILFKRFNKLNSIPFRKLHYLEANLQFNTKIIDAQQEKDSDTSMVLSSEHKSDGLAKDSKEVKPTSLPDKSKEQPFYGLSNKFGKSPFSSESNQTIGSFVNIQSFKESTVGSPALPSSLLDSNSQNSEHGSYIDSVNFISGGLLRHNTTSILNDGTGTDLKAFFFGCNHLAQTKTSSKVFDCIITIIFSEQKFKECFQKICLETCPKYFVKQSLKTFQTIFIQ
ncbi:hypothetical protein RFI_19558 [Reticulomyxa filosa]|uniref:Uncharacterized protein n=1 Tax=Reticulomyxa filosa TaxID=46433 RepID=X6MW99_RETFI|nr:hypothetical protein RFI_19558 [Reticulomyxa filosa]|eukprot:ETO17757.1 hypothetical protein RFI_19558 [Reticulomyxa filosa]